MNRMHRMVVVVHAVAAICTASLSADTLIRGNVAGEAVESTFSFPSRAWATNKDGTRLAIASAVEAKEYALSVLEPMYAQCGPIANEKIRDGHSEFQDNPLYGRVVRSLEMAEKFNGGGDCLALTLEGYPETLYILDNADVVNGHRRLSESPKIFDAGNEKINGGIVGIATASGLLINRSDFLGVAGVAFLAVRGNGEESFGAGNSGISAVFLAKVETKEMRPVKEQPKTEAEQKEEALKKAAQEKADAKKRAAGMEVKKEEPKMEERIITRWSLEALGLQNGRMTAQLNKDSSAVKIGNALAEMGDVVALYWHPTLNRLYVGLQLRAGSGPSDGASALLVGSFAQTDLILKPFVSADLITRGAGNEIVSAIGSSASVAVHEITSMHTSMLLDYLIVVGGNGDEKITKRSVHSLPLLVDPKKTIEYSHKKFEIPSEKVLDVERIGHLAAKNSATHIASQAVDYASRMYHAFDRAPQSASELVRADDASARVGGGPLEYGEIVRIMVHNDSVMAVVRSDDKTLPSGVFISQAIFNEDKHIALWTHWRAVATTYQSLIGANVHPATGAVNLILDAPQATQVKRSTWSDGAETGLPSMVMRINEEFSLEQGGVQGLRTLISDSDHQSLLAVTGLSKVMLIAHEAPSTIFEPGTYQAQVITGGAVSELGAITAATLYEDGRESRLIVAGVEGLAISPVLNESHLVASHDNLGALFTRFGDYRFVKKVVCDGGYLYVLTDTVFDRINMHMALNQDMKSARVRLADARLMAADNEYARLNDVVVSDHVALLATTQGLFVNERIIRDEAISHPADVQWREVALDCDVRNCVNLFAVSATGREQDVARGCGGQLYVLNGFVGNNRARLNRFYIKPLSMVNDIKESVAKLPDSTKGKRCNAYQVFNTYRDLYVNDGIFHLSARYTDDTGKLSVKNGFRLETTILVPKIENGKRIVAVCREPIAGSLLVAGDFGVRVLE